MVRREGDDPAARNARVDDTTQREDNGGTRAAHQETEKSTWDWVLQSWRRYTVNTYTSPLCFSFLREAKLTAIITAPLYHP